jgi:hypothetical protein
LSSQFHGPSGSTRRHKAEDLPNRAADDAATIWVLPAQDPICRNVDNLVADTCSPAITLYPGGVHRPAIRHVAATLTRARDLERTIPNSEWAIRIGPIRWRGGKRYRERQDRHQNQSSNDHARSVQRACRDFRSAGRFSSAGSLGIGCCPLALNGKDVASDGLHVHNCEWDADHTAVRIFLSFRAKTSS